MNQKKGVIRGICISPRRGTAKYPVETAKIVPEYEVLHTQSREYIVDDLLDVMKERGVEV